MDTIVETRSGLLRGRLSDGVATFKGIPYAAPPYGVNRLKVPIAVQPWEGVRDASSFGPKPLAPPYPPGVAEFLAELAVGGEDCLNLNIWTPYPAMALRPVMVWIPGGMFEYHATGASAYYDGSRFARDGVVCVTINYRIGAEGFLYLDDGIGNLGLLDQIASLEWIRDNIAAFGGDPAQVTIFGESAGAMSVATLLAMPRAKGLFCRAIVQSGNTPIVNSAATAGRIGQRLAEKLDVAANREAIADIAPERVLQAQVELRNDLIAHPDPVIWGEVAISFLPWAPTFDGKTIPGRPIDAILTGAADGIDLLVGTNTEETRLFLLSDGSIDRISNEALGAIATAYGLSNDGLAAYRAAHPSASAGDLFSAIQTDWYWRMPAVRLADAHAANASGATYMYEFAWHSPQMGGRLGAAHGVEMPFVFDTLGLGTETMLGHKPPQRVADRMHRAWVAFAMTGNCGWPKYELLRRQTMHFDTTSMVLDNPMAVAIARWNSARS